MPGPPFGPSLRTDEWPFLTVPLRNGLHAFFFALEHDGFAFKAQAFLAGDFSDRAFGGEVAVEDDEVAVLFDRFDRADDDGLARRIWFSRRATFQPWSRR